MTVAVALLGARMGYAVPRILHSVGLLERLFTDLCAVKGWPRLLHRLPAALQTAQVKRILGRNPANIPAERITAFNDFGLAYAWRRARATSPNQALEAFLWAGQTLCRKIERHGLGNARAVFTFDSAGLELLQHAKRKGLATFMEQTVAPMTVMCQLMEEEFERHPDWQLKPSSDGWRQFADREAAEWELADRIVCGSEFVRQSIQRAGGPSERCTVVPYGVDSPVLVPRNTDRRGPLRVLSVGSVGLRKGAPYVFEAARRLQGVAEFRMVGPIELLPRAVDRLREAVDLRGPIPRSDVMKHFQWADVFLLPSVCEGSATVTYEALGCGLPVVCTPNTGSVVQDGVNGFLVPLRDVDSICQRIEQLATDRDLLAQLSKQAHHAALDLTVESYGHRLITAMKDNGAVNPQVSPPRSTSGEPCAYSK